MYHQLGWFQIIHSVSSFLVAIPYPFFGLKMLISGSNGQPVQQLIFFVHMELSKDLESPHSVIHVCHHVPHEFNSKLGKTWGKTGKTQ